MPTEAQAGSRCRWVDGTAAAGQPVVGCARGQAVQLRLATSQQTMCVRRLCVFCVQMGMGKTACAVGAIQLNRPPEDWRKNRSYQTLRARDHLCEWSHEGLYLQTHTVARSCNGSCNFWEQPFNLARVCPRCCSPAASIVNNMPHGGTLIIMPASLVEQW